MYVVIGGDLQGYLSPCGCTKPMIGGIKRRGTALAAIRKKGQVVALENCGLVADTGEQSRIKFATILETLSTLKVDAVHFSAPELKLDLADWVAAENLLPGRILSEADPGALGWSRSRTLHGLDVSVDPAEPGDVLLLNGGLDAARQVAHNRPEAKIVVYRQSGNASSKPEKLGQTWLLTAGDSGKGLVEVRMLNGKPDGYRVVDLSPDFEDDPAVARIYSRYTQRVAASGLLDRVDRRPSEAFAGTAACSSCHGAAAKVWKNSEHAHALASLSEAGHDRDPECVPCHVVGLDRKGGFESVAKTAQLANVGCESCHGPGKAHADSPATVRMGKVGEASCQPCHEPEHSPGFNFKDYWRSIAH